MNRALGTEVEQVGLAEHKVMGTCLNCCEVGSIPYCLGQESSEQTQQTGEEGRLIS